MDEFLSEITDTLSVFFVELKGVVTLALGRDLVSGNMDHICDWFHTFLGASVVFWVVFLAGAG